jgi:DNA-binding SARP family transcriptional activator
MFEIWLLGRFALARDGVPVELPSRAAQSLVAYLTLHAGRAHRREQLAGLIWPEAAEASARRNLRQALWQIRKALRPSPSAAPDDLLLAGELVVGLNPRSALWLDAAHLQAPLRPTAPVEAHMAAAAAYAGELLPGFYDEWVLRERERLLAVFERHSGWLLQALRAQRRWTELAAWAEHWIERAPAPEAAYVALLEAHAALGNHAALATVYRRCVEALQRELGVEPAPATRALYEQLRAARPGQAHGNGAAPKANGAAPHGTASSRQANRHPPRAEQASEVPPYGWEGWPPPGEAPLLP